MGLKGYGSSWAWISCAGLGYVTCRAEWSKLYWNKVTRYGLQKIWMTRWSGWLQKTKTKNNPARNLEVPLALRQHSTVLIPVLKDRPNDWERLEKISWFLSEAWLTHGFLFLARQVHNDHPCTMLHLWQSCGEQVGSLPGPLAGRIHRRVSLEVLLFAAMYWWCAIKLALELT